MIFNKKKVKNNNEKSIKNYYFDSKNQSLWSDFSYTSLAKNGFLSNVIANRCINLISQCVASINLLVYDENGVEIENQDINKLLSNPNKNMSKSDFLQSMVKNLLISGNCYIKSTADSNDKISEMLVLRPDKISALVDNQNNIIQYLYNNEQLSEMFDVNVSNGKDDILHIKYFNPIDDIYGLSPLYTARFSIDQYNEAIAWNKALLQNGARPSGALVVDSSQNDLTDEQFDRLRNQLQGDFTGSKAAGKIMILEGGLKWQEMSISPKDMDFIETKHSAARDIALAFGVPSNLMGIPGDNTYSNLAESRVALWEETIVPLAEMLLSRLSFYINSYNQTNIKIVVDLDSISSLSEKRYQVWQYLNNANFLTNEEKRKILGF